MELLPHGLMNRPVNPIAKGMPLKQFIKYQGDTTISQIESQIILTRPRQKVPGQPQPNAPGTCGYQLKNKNKTRKES